MIERAIEQIIIKLIKCGQARAHVRSKIEVSNLRRSDSVEAQSRPGQVLISQGAPNFLLAIDVAHRADTGQAAAGGAAASNDERTKNFDVHAGGQFDRGSGYAHRIGFGAGGNGFEAP